MKYQLMVQNQVKNLVENFDTVIINDNGDRYINVNLTMIVWKGYFKDAKFKSVISDKLKEMTFTFVDTNNKAKVYSVQSDKKFDFIINSTSGKQKKFKINYNNGFLVNKNILKFLKIESKKQYLSGSVNVKLLVPNDIETDSLILKSNQLTLSDYDNYGIHYDVFVNDTKPSKELGKELDVKIIHDNGIRYINVNLTIVIWKGYFQSSKGHPGIDLFNRISGLSFIATDTDDSEKWHALNPMNAEKTQEYNVTVNKYNHKSKNKTHEVLNNKFKILHDKNGFIFQKKALKYLTNNNKKTHTSVVVNLKLLVPNHINADSLIVKANQFTLSDYDNYGVHYEASINGSKPSKELGKEFEVEAINKNGLRYVNLNLTMIVWKEYVQKGKGHLGMELLNRISGLSFIATDVDDGEKWYALNPIKE